jgi:plastocyanin
MKLTHPISALAVIGAAGLLVAGCGGGGGSTTAKTSSQPSTPASSGSSGPAVRISNFKFVPATVTAAHGARVAVTNNDSTAHTATADDGHSFDTGSVDPGASKAITVSKPGSYPYHCSIHPFMHGTLVVK